MIAQWKLRYCKTRMVAFINGDLSEKARRRVGRYIDDCPACYDEYILQRNALQEIKPALRGMGIPDARQLDRIWGNIQAEMAADYQKVVANPTRIHRTYQRTTYAVAMIVTILLIVAPLMLGKGDVSLAADTTLPEPVQRLTLARTDPPEDNVRSIAAATAESELVNTVYLGTTQQAITLQATPRPVLEPDEND